MFSPSCPATGMIGRKKGIQLHFRSIVNKNPRHARWVIPVLA